MGSKGSQSLRKGNKKKTSRRKETFSKKISLSPAEKDKAILQERRKGTPYDVIASKYGVSPKRISKVERGDTRDSGEGVKCFELFNRGKKPNEVVTLAKIDPIVVAGFWERFVEMTGEDPGSVQSYRENQLDERLTEIESSVGWIKKEILSINAVLQALKSNQTDIEARVESNEKDLETLTETKACPECGSEAAYVMECRSCGTKIRRRIGRE